MTGETEGHEPSLPRRRPKSRRVAPALTTAMVLVGALIAATVGQPSTPPTLRIRGADISFTLQEEAINQLLSDNGTTAPIETILAGHGANYARLRLWVDPPSGTSDLKSTLELARRARAAGLQLLLDLHYSDSWADRTTQQIPAAWRGLSQAELQNTVENYSREVVAAFARQGTPADIVQIGNEVTHGMLWPHGRIYPASGENWAGFVELLKAGARGARAGNPDHAPLIMIHTDTGGDKDASVYFFDRLKQQGVNFDLVGLSYYPFWHGSLATLRDNLHSLAARYGKDIIIAETAYPWTLGNGGNVPSVVSSAAALPDLRAYPATPHGQAKFFEALNRILREVPDGHGAGYFIWEPGWLPGVPADARTGNTHSNLTLFDWWGRGLPALDAFRPAGRANS